MRNKPGYPDMRLYKKKDLAKRISHSQLSIDKANALIDDVEKNFDKYWADNLQQSEPAKGKFVRTAFNTPLGKLLSLIDRRVLARYDSILPDFIFGGLSGRSHVLADKSLLGKKGKRSLISLDIEKFFEGIKRERVFYFIYHMCGCSAEIANLIANICTVPKGPKGSGVTDKVLGRGFATSPRLSVWCNLNTFNRLNWLIKRKLKKHDPRIAIFIDDIGITASSTNKEQMKIISDELQVILEKFDANQPLLVNKKKTKNLSFQEGVEHLGLRLGKRLSLGSKTRSKYDKTKALLKEVSNSAIRKKLLKKKKAYFQYKKYISR